MKTIDEIKESAKKQSNMVGIQNLYYPVWVVFSLKVERKNFSNQQDFISEVNKLFLIRITKVRMSILDSVASKFSKCKLWEDDFKRFSKILS